MTVRLTDNNVTDLINMRGLTASGYEVLSLALEVREHRAEIDRLRAEIDRLRAAMTLDDDERAMVNRVLANEVDPEYVAASLTEIFAFEALVKVLDPRAMQRVREANVITARSASAAVEERYRLAVALDRLTGEADRG